MDIHFLLFSLSAACSQVQCDAGLMACYESGGTQNCCNFYDVSDNCLSECGTNQEPDGSYTCVCTGFFEPPGTCNCKQSYGRGKGNGGLSTSMVRSPCSVYLRFYTKRSHGTLSIPQSMPKELDSSSIGIVAMTPAVLRASEITLTSPGASLMRVSNFL